MGRRWFMDALFGRSSRQISKMRTLLCLTVSRLAVLRRQYHARCSIARADLIQLLLIGQQDRALIRAELVIKEQNMIDVFAMVESYCCLLNERAFLLQHQKECPEELCEAAAGLIFASSRCRDLPELLEIRNILSSRLGKQVAAAAAELRNNCGVNGKLVQKLSTRQPSLESRIKLMEDIAIEKEIKLEPITRPFSESLEVDEHPRQWTEKMVPAHPGAACIGADKLKVSAQEYTDAESAAQAAFESAAYAAGAARAAVELFQSQSKRKGYSNDSKSTSTRKNEPEDHLVGRAAQEKLLPTQFSKWTFQ